MKGCELADVYSVIGYYLRHKVEVDEYLRQQDVEAEEVRKLFDTPEQVECSLDNEWENKVLHLPKYY